MNTSIFEIYKVFFYIGIQLLGGGYVIVPLLKKYVVDEKKWMSEEELIDFYAMSQCIPGIIACNIATSAGYKAKGLFGALTALMGIITSPFLIIVFLAKVLPSITNFQIVQNAFWGIRISVIILIIMTIKEIWGKSVNSKFSYILFFIILLLLLVLPISPTIIIILSAITALIYSSIRRKING